MLQSIIDHYGNISQFDGVLTKTALFSLVASELSRYSPKENPWTWRYVQGVVAGRMKAGKYMEQAIEMLSDEIAGKPVMIPVPACPVSGCTDPHQHKHGEQVFDPSIQTVKLITKPSKPRPDRISIYKHNPASAARTIIDNLPPATVRELMQNLMSLTNG